MTEKLKRDADGLPHSKPGSVDQQMEDTFPASDAPSFSSSVIGAPKGRETRKPHEKSRRAMQAGKKVKSGNAKKPKIYWHITS